MKLFINYIQRDFFLFLITISIIGIESCSKGTTVTPTPDPTPTPTPTPDSTPARPRFVIYSQIRYNNTPADLSQYGISASVIHPPTQFLTADPNVTPTGNTNTDNTVINAPALAALAKADLSVKANVPIVLDIESWSYGSSQIKGTVDSFTKAINIYKAVNPKSPLGFYAGVPQIKYQWSNLNSGSAQQVWYIVDNYLKPVAQLMNFFAPSFYTRDPYADSSNWKLFAQYNYQECKRLNPNIPIYAYIEPQYANSSQNNTTVAAWLEAGYWKFELEQLYDIGYDGVIIWTSNKDSNFDTTHKYIDFTTAIQQPWWQTTLDFIKEKNIVAQ